MHLSIQYYILTELQAVKGFSVIVYFEHIFFCFVQRDLACFLTNNMGKDMERDLFTQNTRLYSLFFSQIITYQNFKPHAIFFLSIELKRLAVWALSNLSLWQSHYKNDFLNKPIILTPDKYDFSVEI